MIQEKTIGLVGGIAPESTIEYYRCLIAEHRARVKDASYPTILIDSIDLTRMIGYVERGELDSLVVYLSAEVARLAAAGADLAAFASNTPHIVFDEVRRRSPIPLVSIVEATRDEALAIGLKRLGLFGTRFTMEAAFYPDVFRARALTVVAPAGEDRAYIHEKYFSELVKGVFAPETRERLLAIARRMRERDGIEGIILGGTELPLALRDAASPGLPFLDTTRIHVKRIVEEMFSAERSSS
jgi:aspartate racemase